MYNIICGTNKKCKVVQIFPLILRYLSDTIEKTQICG